MNEISGNSHETSRGDAAKNSSEAARETSAASVELAKFADELNAIVAVFRLSASTPEQDPETRSLVAIDKRESAKAGRHSTTGSAARQKPAAGVS